MKQKATALLTCSLLVLAFGLVSAETAEAKRYMTSGFRTKETRPMTVAVLPPQAEFIKKKVLVSHELVDEATALEKAALSRIADMLEDRGYEVRVVTTDQILGDSDLQENIRRANKRYDEEWKRLVRKPKRVKVGRYQAGNEMRQMADSLGVDGIVIPRIQAVGATKGQKAMAYIFGGNPGYARLDLSVVDGKTGTIEAYFFGLTEAGFKSLTTKPDKMMMKITKMALKKYPKSSQILKAKGPEREEQDEDYDEETDAAILGDLEALIGSAAPDEEDGNGGGSP